VDIKLYAKDMKVLRNTYLSVVSEPSGLAWHDFKRRVSTRIHYKWILTVVERLYSSIDTTIQWLSFDERLQTDTNKDISDEIRDYVLFEEDLRQRTYDEDLLTELQEIVAHWFRNLTLSLEYPKGHFGPGATAELGRTTTLEKAKKFLADPSTVDLLCSVYYRERVEMFPYSAWTESPLGAESSRTNRIIFVPKNALKHRIISAEPTWLTWAQQILKESMYNYIERSPEMFSWFSNQEASRKLALQGSIDGSYATIDFSSASDSITVPIVDKVFARTELHEPLMRTRSTQGILPDDTIVRLTKFAPMGSATCFAVMDTIFLSICELSVRRTKNRKGRNGDYVVYGDDVVIRTEFLPAFGSICESLKLEINQDKSFTSQTGRKYREACGIECCDGRDVSPLRYSRFQLPILSRAPISLTYWEQTIDLLNRMFFKRFLNMRSICTMLIKHSIDCGKKQKRKFSSHLWYHFLRIDEYDYQHGRNGPMAIIVPDGTATNYHSKERYNRDLQRIEVLVSVPYSEYATYAEDRTAYDLWHLFANQKERLAGYDSMTFTVIGDIPLMQGRAGTLDLSKQWKDQWVGL
jgi:hypothetical protein